MLQWTTTGQHAADHGIKVCVHGRSGSGKTTLIGTAPRPIIASAEAGTLSIASLNIPMANIGGYNDLMDFYQWALTSADRRNYDTISLDSISDIAERLLTEEKSKTKDPRKAYGEMADKLATMIRNFRDLSGINVYFTAKSIQREVEGGTKIWSPMLPGQSNAQGLAYYFDEFFYAGVAEAPSAVAGGPMTRYHYLHTKLDSQHDAKDRSGVLDMIERPDLNYIFTKIRQAAQVQPAVAA
jgi:hypothetical protein